jgi:hypothetical protein
VSSNTVAFFIHRQPGQCGLSVSTHILAVSSLNYKMGSLESASTRKITDNLTAADGLRASRIGRVRSRYAAPEGGERSVMKSLSLTAPQAQQAFPGSGLVVDPAIGHPSGSTLAHSFQAMMKVKCCLAEQHQSISHRLKPQTISPSLIA